MSEAMTVEGLKLFVEAQNILLLSLAATHPSPGVLLEDFSKQISKMIEARGDDPGVYGFLSMFESRVRAVIPSTPQ